VEEESVPSRKLPLLFLVFIATPSPYPRTSQDTNCLDFASILGWVKSLEHIYLFGFGLSNQLPNPILLGPRTPHNSPLKPCYQELL